MSKNGSIRTEDYAANDPDELCDQIRNPTWMQLIGILAACWSNVTAYRNVQNAYRIALKSLARRYLELHDEVAGLDVMAVSILDELALS